MNARLYDPETARFLSADIYIQAPESSQSHNRYIYVMNNPLKYSDPSGHFAFSFIIGAVISIISSQIDNPYIRAIGMIAGAALMGGQITGFEGGLFGSEAIFSNAFAAGFVSGGISSGSAKGAFIGGFSALATAGIGHGKGGNAIFKSKWAVAASHGVAQGATAELRGGSFKTGFIGGFAGHYAPSLGIDRADASDVIARTSVAGIWGGMIAEASGGSFRNGAFHASMVHLFNSELKRIGESIAQNAESHIGSKKWNYDVNRTNFPSGSNKCNLFVAETIRGSGARLSNINGRLVSRYPPTAGQWADPNFKIDNWVVVSDLMRGDIIAQAIPYSDATGHVAIFVGNGKTVGTSGPNKMISRTDWGFRDSQKGKVVYRRYNGNGSIRW